MPPSTLRLNLLDVYGKFINQNVNILLKPQGLGGTIRESVSSAGPIEINGLSGAPQGLYQIQIDSPSYQLINQFVNMKASGVTELTASLPIDPERILTVQFPKYNSLPKELADLLDRSDQILGFEGKSARDLFDAVTSDPVRGAGLLNIAAKSRLTKLTGGKTVLPAFNKIREIRGDRFFVDVSQRLREDTKNSVHEGLFTPVDGSLHHMENGFTLAGSFKTKDHYGNLQLTFFTNGEDWVADVDIDDASGIEHVFQVIVNTFNGPTNPYNIHEILVGFQHIDPGYSFNV